MFSALSNAPIFRDIPRVTDESSLHFGTCAWTYGDWDGVFYPPHLPPTERLAYYARWFDLVEADSTFYHTPTTETTAHWAEVTPAHFRFSCKVPREITHERKLRDCAEPLAAFLRSMEPLGEKLACLLVQLPPWFAPRHNELALREFLVQLPRNFRWAVEFRDHAWRFPRIAHLLEEFGIAWVWNDATTTSGADEAPFDFHPRTADFAVLRLMGDPDTKYHPDGSRRNRYSELQWRRDGALENWAAKIRLESPHLRATYVLSSNHYEGYAPRTLQRFAAMLGREQPLPGNSDLHGDARAEQRELWE